MTESLLKRNNIFEILAPTVGGAFLFSYFLSKHFGLWQQFESNIVIYSVLGGIVVLLSLLFNSNSKYVLFALVTFSSSLTAAFLNPTSILPLYVSSVAACFLFVFYVIKDKLYFSLIMILSAILLLLFIEESFFLQINRVILIVATSLFLIPKILRYEKNSCYNKFVVMTVIVPVVAAFVTENVGYNRIFYAAAYLSAIIGAGFFENAYKFKKEV